MSSSRRIQPTHPYRKGGPSETADEDGNMGPRYSAKIEGKNIAIVDFVTHDAVVLPKEDAVQLVTQVTELLGADSDSLERFTADLRHLVHTCPWNKDKNPHWFDNLIRTMETRLTKT